MGRLDVASSTVQRFDAPDHPILSGTGRPVPYQQRLAPDGTVWMSELIGNRIPSVDPRSGDVWVAYGASPALHPSRIARLSLR
jgi:streptogramin lyase